MGVRVKLLSIFTLLIFPMLFGWCVSSLLNSKNTIIGKYILGNFSIFALIQIIAIPIIFLNNSFAFFKKIFTIVICVITLVGIVFIFIRKQRIVLKKIKLSEIVIILVTFSFCFLFIKNASLYQYIDDDDSRFVVNAVDIVETDRLFLTNPCTGEELIDFSLGDSYKDICSPWAIYFALVSASLNCSVSIVVHTILPMFLSILAMAVWYEFSKCLFKDNIVLNCSFLIIMLIFNMFGYSFDKTELSKYQTTVSKFMLRPWQGKSLVAYAGIPTIYMYMFKYYDDSNIQNIFSIFIVNLGLCLLSGNGIVIGAIVIGVFSLIYSIIKRNPIILFRLLPLATPNAMYYLIGQIIRTLK